MVIKDFETIIKGQLETGPNLEMSIIELEELVQYVDEKDRDEAQSLFDEVFEEFVERRTS